MRKVGLVFVITIIALIGCSDDRVYTPKPRMYPRVIYPVGEYQQVNVEACKFLFEAPTYVTIKEDVAFFDEQKLNPCWFDLNFDDLNASLHFSYTQIQGENTFDKLISDAFRLVSEHNKKAEYRDEIRINNEYGVEGLKFKIGGPVASPINFYLTDSIEHFVRASLYFNDTVNPDSIAPVLEFVEKDIDHMLGSFSWK